jgi:hypothetical protein
VIFVCFWFSFDSSSVKEFSSSDTSKQMNELSFSFERKVSILQQSVTQLKASIDHSNHSHYPQLLLHYRLIQQFLSKAICNQVESFKASLKLHQKHLDERNKRIEKYGSSSISSMMTPSSSASSLASQGPLVHHSSGLINGFSSGISNQTSQYAMFQSPPSLCPVKSLSDVASSNQSTPSTPCPFPQQATSSLTHRKGANKGMIPLSSSSFSQDNYYNNPLAQQTQTAVKKDEHRLRHAEKAEASIKQVFLFSLFFTSFMFCYYYLCSVFIHCRWVISLVRWHL